MSTRQFRLSDGDRERLGCPEWIDALDASTLTVDEAALIQHQTPYRGPGDFRAALLGVPAVSVDGAPVLEDKLDADGAPILRPDGSREQAQVRDPDFQAAKVATWLALRRTGTVVPYKDFTFAIFAVEFRDLPDSDPPAGEEIVDAAGKGDGSTPLTTSEP